jgi:hypothetical protein
MFGRAEPPTISVNAISVTPQSEAWMFNIGILLLGIMLITIGLGVAVDVPFVFDETSANVASYTSAQLEQVRTSSPDLAGVPIVSLPSNDEILAFPVTGGGSTPEGTTDKKVGELKESLSARVEPDNSVVRHEAVVLAAKYPGDRTIDQISSIYSYLKNGADSKKGWSYVADTRGIDNFMYANETLEIGKDAGCVGAGDCDDFAILMAALVESIGGTTRIILARNNTTGGHAYTEVYLGNLDASNSQVEEIISWLKDKFDTDKIYTHIDTATKDVWLNLDWGPDEKGNTHPGGPFFQGDKHIVLSIRDTFVKTPLRLPEKSNKPPNLIGLTSDESSPQDAGTVITWTAEAKDVDKDPVLYLFTLNGDSVTNWIRENQWIWNTTKDDLGENKIVVQVRDGKHAGLDSYDDAKSVQFKLSSMKLMVQTWVRTIDTIQGYEEFGQDVTSIQQTSDRGYIIAGYEKPGMGRPDDVLLIKTDASGNKIWDKTFGGGSGILADCYSVRQTKDSGYIITGATYYSGAGQGDVWLIKTDADGNKIWDKTFGGSGSDFGDSVQQTNDGGYIIAGLTSTESYGAGKDDVWLIKTDADGNKIWDRTFGGTLGDVGSSVQQTNDGGYIIAGSTESYGAGKADVWLIKTDADGNKIWDKTFGGSSSDSCGSVQQTNDGGYIIAGSTESYGAGKDDVWLIKTDADGNKIWDKTFGGSSYDFGVSVQETSDGEYIIGSTTESFGDSAYGLLIKTDAYGNKLWDKTFVDSNIGNSVQRTRIGNLAQLTYDGGYIIAGNAIGGGVTLIKTDPNGNV